MNRNRQKAKKEQPVVCSSCHGRARNKGTEHNAIDAALDQLGRRELSHADMRNARGQRELDNVSTARRQDDAYKTSREADSGKLTCAQIGSGTEKHSPTKCSQPEIDAAKQQGR